MRIPTISVVARSNTGKTTLVVKLIAEFKRRGYRVGALKHDAHKFDIDKEGKDSWRMTHAGADTMVITSSEKTAMVKIHTDEGERNLSAFVNYYFWDMDIVFTEGFKKSSFPKIEVHRKEKDRTLVCRGENHDDTLIAVVSNEEMDVDVPLFDIDDPKHIYDFIEKRFLKKPKGAKGAIDRQGP